jgi:CRP-like cAMP-binding protein
MVGGLGILTGEPRRAHVEAETDMDLWVMTKDQFNEMTEKDPALLDFITELVADRFDSRRPASDALLPAYYGSMRGLWVRLARNRPFRISRRRLTDAFQ